MKILHVVRQFSPAIGGIENFVYCLAREQMAQGHEVTVLTLNRVFRSAEILPAKDVVDGIAVLRVPFWGSMKYPLALSCLGHLRGFDLVHVHAVDFFADYLALLKPFHRKPLVLHTHGGFFHTKWLLLFKKIFFRLVTPISLRAFDKVIADGSCDEKLFRPICPHVVMVENGVDTRKFSGIVRRSQPGCLVYIGRIDVHKRVDRLIELTAQLNKGGTSVRLRVIGPDWKGLLPALTDLAKSLGGEGQVDFLGAVSDDVMLQEMSKAQVILSASEYEGFGIAAIEAMAGGCVCVLNRIGAFEKFVTDGENGFLVDFSSPEAAERVKKILGLPDTELARISRAAREFAARYSWSKVARRISDIYLEIPGIIIEEVKRQKRNSGYVRR